MLFKIASIIQSLSSCYLSVPIVSVSYTLINKSLNDQSLEDSCVSPRVMAKMETNGFHWQMNAEWIVIYPFSVYFTAGAI